MARVSWTPRNDRLHNEAGPPAGGHTSPPRAGRVSGPRVRGTPASVYCTVIFLALRSSGLGTSTFNTPSL